LETGQIVAIKKIKLGSLSSESARGIDEGVSFSAIREIKSLQEVKHQNIVNLLDVFVNKKNIHLVFEFCGQGDLEQVIKDVGIAMLQENDIKQYMKMILESVEYCHRHWILHRDLKPSNLLLWKNEETKETELKLADFVSRLVFDWITTNRVWPRYMAHPTRDIHHNVSPDGTEHLNCCSELSSMDQVLIFGVLDVFLLS